MAGFRNPLSRHSALAPKYALTLAYLFFPSCLFSFWEHHLNFFSAYPIVSHMSWPSQSPVFPGTFESQPTLFSSLFSKHILPGSLYVPFYLLLLNDSPSIVSELFQRIFFNCPLDCVLPEDKIVFPWLLSLHSIPTPDPSIILWLQKKI